MKRLLIFAFVLCSYVSFGQSYVNGTTGRFTTLNGLLKANGTSNLSVITDGTSGQALTTDGAGNYSFTTVSGANPGGSNTQLQYRVNATTFGGISGATSSGTNVTFGSGNLRATSPWVSTSILDANGNVHFGLTATGSAVNYLQYANSATGNNPKWTVTGSDTNIGLDIIPKGTGKLRVYADNTSQLNFSNSSVNDGGYLTSDGTNQALISGGAQFTGTAIGSALAWTARATASSALWINGSEVQFYANTGLTAGNTFTPTNVVTIENTGNLDLKTGDLETNGTTRISNAGAGTLSSLSLTTQLPVSSGGTGVNTITGYLKGNGTSAFTGSATIPTSDLTGTLGVANGGTGASSYTVGRILFGNGTSPINTNSELFWDNSATFLGIGTTPASQLHVYENNATTGTANGITIEQNGTGDAMQQYLLTGGVRYVQGIDNSDSDKFKLSVGTSLGSTDLMTFTSGSSVVFSDNLNAPKLGIGAATFPSIAHIYESTSNTGATAGLTIENASTGDAVSHLIAGGTTWSVGVDNDQSDRFNINSGSSVEAGATGDFFKLQSGTNAGGTAIIGKEPTTPASKLYVGISSSLDLVYGGLEVIVDTNDATQYGAKIQAGTDAGTGTNYLMIFNDGDGTNVGNITYNGTTTTYGSVSDIRLKKGVVKSNIDPKVLIGLTKDFEWRESGEKQTGFIAQEVYKVFPWAVSNPDSGMWSVDYGQLTPLLAKGYEEHDARIESLERKKDNTIHLALWGAIFGLAVLVLGCIYVITTLLERVSKLEKSLK